MTICTHLCRGNFKSGWMAEGSYEHRRARWLCSDLSRPSARRSKARTC
jgi:hypothetical protein